MKIMLCLLTLFFVGCAKQPMQPLLGIFDPPGFFHGFLHGVILPFSFIGSWFTDYRIYAFPNSGLWYDFGFILGLSPSFGGLIWRRRRR